MVIVFVSVCVIMSIVRANTRPSALSKNASRIMMGLLGVSRVGTSQQNRLGCYHGAQRIASLV
jgi:hypothetical protein